MREPPHVCARGRVLKQAGFNQCLNSQTTTHALSQVLEGTAPPGGVSCAGEDQSPRGRTPGHKACRLGREVCGRCAGEQELEAWVHVHLVTVDRCACWQAFCPRAFFCAHPLAVLRKISAMRVPLPGPSSTRLSLGGWLSCIHVYTTHAPTICGCSSRQCDGGVQHI